MQIESVHVLSIVANDDGWIFCGRQGSSTQLDDGLSGVPGSGSGGERESAGEHGVQALAA